MNYLGPKRGILSMHCSATADKKTGVSSLLFGLSGTGKTTLSADPKRQNQALLCNGDSRTLYATHQNDFLKRGRIDDSL